MTPQEAIERISQLKVRPKPDNALDLCALIMAKKALEKRIPQMPKIIGSPADYNERCPNCNERVDIFADSRFCQQCGQALDWS